MIFENGDISQNTKRILGIRDYMSVSLSDIERDIETIKSFLDSEICNKEFMSILGNWGNTCTKRTKTLALLEYVKNEDANRFYKFAHDWVLMMASLDKPGYSDGRNEMAVKECVKIAKALYWTSECSDALNDIPKKFKYLVEYSLHRTIMQTLTEIFLRGLVASMEVLGMDSNIEMLEKLYDVEDIEGVFAELIFPLI